METQLLPALLRANPYPGRGILLGRSADGQRRKTMTCSTWPNCNTQPTG